MHSRLTIGKMRAALFAVAASCMVAGARGSNLPLPASEATQSIKARDLRKHLSFLASNELGGRYTLSPSNLIAARYLASQLESYGYRGAARDGSFFQKVPLKYRKVDSARSSLSVTAGGARKQFKYADDFASEALQDSRASGGLVFVGYGISSPENGWDDYSGVDTKGKIIVAVVGTPESLKKAKLSENERGRGAAEAHGAIGEIIITPPQLLSSWDWMKNSSLQEQISLSLNKKVSGGDFPQVYAGPALIKTIAEAMGKDPAYLNSYEGKEVQSVVIPAAADFNVSVEVKDASPAQNVVGILDGADPKLEGEYVAFSAHYDHLKTSDNGEVYAGADDDGSGTVSVLEIAQAFTVGARPPRSILVIFHTGEELGLLGSQYNTDYDPVVPLDKLVADFNIDMVGRSKPEGDNDPRDSKLTDKDSIYIIGADKLSSELNRISEETDSETERLRFDYTYNDEANPERFYYRSDHYNYAKHGIPIIFYFTGVHRDYHQPTDSVDKIDFGKMERIDRLIFATGWRVANMDHRPLVDKKPAGSGEDAH